MSGRKLFYIEDVIAVLENYGVGVRLDGDDLVVSGKDLEDVFKIEDGFIHKRVVHKWAKKYGIPIDHFFYPERSS